LHQVGTSSLLTYSKGVPRQAEVAPRGSG